VANDTTGDSARGVSYGARRMRGGPKSLCFDLPGWQENRPGSIQYTVRTNDQGVVEELKTRSSLSILGFQVYYFAQDLHEVWRGGELQSLQGNTDDHRTIFKSSLQRNPTEYDGVLNGKTLALPHDAFPNSVWHYAITINHCFLT
jgi:Domain of unknown function (DUF6134)